MTIGNEIDDDAVKQILSMFDDGAPDATDDDILAKLKEAPGLVELLATHWQNEHPPMILVALKDRLVHNAK